MAKKSTHGTQGKKSGAFGQPRLPFHSPTFTKAEKAELAEKSGKGDIRLIHFNDVLSQDDWLKVRFDSDNGVWLVIHSFTGGDNDAPIGLVTYRAKRLENALAMAIWKAGELSESDFITEEDDDF